MGSLSSLQKSEFLKLIISFFHYFSGKIEISGKKWVEKTPIYIFFTFRKKMSLSGKNLKKNEKIPKT
jgi:hypothetical protein